MLTKDVKWTAIADKLQDYASADDVARTLSHAADEIIAYYFNSQMGKEYGIDLESLDFLQFFSRFLSATVHATAECEMLRN